MALDLRGLVTSFSSGKLDFDPSTAMFSFASSEDGSSVSAGTVEVLAACLAELAALRREHDVIVEVLQGRAALVEGTASEAVVVRLDGTQTALGATVLGA